MGNVKSLNYRRTGKERILKPYDDGHDYLKVGLFKDGKKKNCRINRLVAIAFIPNPYNLPEVNHIDQCRINNNVENLEWCTSQYNVEYSKAKAIIGIDRITSEFPKEKSDKPCASLPKNKATFCLGLKPNTSSPDISIAILTYP